MVRLFLKKANETTFPFPNETETHRITNTFIRSSPQRLHSLRGHRPAYASGAVPDARSGARSAGRDPREDAERA